MSASMQLRRPMSPKTKHYLLVLDLGTTYLTFSYIYIFPLLQEYKEDETSLQDALDLSIKVGQEELFHN
jgi:hypothetical protein